MRQGAYSHRLPVKATLACAESRPSPPRSFDPSQASINALADCKQTAPDARIVWDPINRLNLIDGPGAGAFRRCLVERHGWTELGPPEYAAGTMSSPN